MIKVPVDSFIVTRVLDLTILNAVNGLCII